MAGNARDFHLWRDFVGLEIFGGTHEVIMGMLLRDEDDAADLGLFFFVLEVFGDVREGGEFFAHGDEAFAVFHFFFDVDSFLDKERGTYLLDSWM